MKKLLLSLALSAVAVTALANGDAPVAQTRAGQVRGALVDGINVFKGVRYGATTEGRRFMPPQPAQPWQGVAEARDYGNQSPQSRPSSISLFKTWANPRPASEDLLFLNVWTPAVHDGKKRPVMVWFHGGGFSTGSGSSHAYDGTRLAKKGDVVVVTVNHRLNAFGYLYLAGLSQDSALADSGNIGNLDMVLSLQWVRDNIAEFGGDPGNVLIFGESGGGAKVSTLLAMPAARGLFHKAVVQSGSMIKAQTPERATQGTKAFLQLLGIAPENLAELRTMPMQKIADALNNLPPEGAVNFGPVMDGRSLPRHPFDPDAPAISAQVPLMVGTIKDETTLLIGARDPSAFAITWEDLPKRLQPFAGTIDPAVFIDGMRKLAAASQGERCLLHGHDRAQFPQRRDPSGRAEVATGRRAGVPLRARLGDAGRGRQVEGPARAGESAWSSTTWRSRVRCRHRPEAQKVADQMSAVARVREAGNPAGRPTTRSAAGGWSSTWRRRRNDPEKDEQRAVARSASART